MALTPNDSVPDSPASTETLTKASLPPKDVPKEQQKLWEAAYREQQERRSCPGCGDDSGLI